MPAMHYKDRAAHCKNAVGRRLLTLMDAKRTNLCVSADLTTAAAVLQLADLVGPHVCLLKTHVDIISDFSPEFIERLVQLSEKHNFLIFEDRKFADIGSTVKQQYEGGVYKIADWAHLTNAHLVPGPGIVEGLKEVGMPRERGLLLLAQMSSKGSLATGAYTDACCAVAAQHEDFVTGAIGQEQLFPSLPGMLVLTPGVNLGGGGDGLGQQYNTPHHVVAAKGCDIIIVGRAICNATDPAATASIYREEGWKAYLARVNEVQ